uniref:Uncharacterized protein n=1 Tax=Arundo donax TaxID=35708 RepID=A0A0A9CYN1_ARUDO
MVTRTLTGAKTGGCGGGRRRHPHRGGGGSGGGHLHPRRRACSGGRHCRGDDGVGRRPGHGSGGGRHSGRGSGDGHGRLGSGGRSSSDPSAGRWGWDLFFALEIEERLVLVGFGVSGIEEWGGGRAWGRRLRSTEGDGVRKDAGWMSDATLGSGQRGRDRTQAGHASAKGVEEGRRRCGGAMVQCVEEGRRCGAEEEVERAEEELLFLEIVGAVRLD